MTAEQLAALEHAVRTLCQYLEAERASLERLSTLLDEELAALQDLDRERITDLNTQKVQVLQAHQQLLLARPWYLAPFSPQAGSTVSLSYICTHLPVPFNGWVHAFQEALKALAIEIKERQARNELRANTAREIIRSTRRNLEQKDPDHRRSRVYTARGKIRHRIPRGRGYGKG